METNRSRVSAALLALAALCAAAPAYAQKKPSKEDAPITRTPDSQRSHPEAYPRLDPGAVLCDSASDLDQHFAAMDAQLDRTPNAPTEPLGCRTIRVTVPITVLERASPGHTQVKLSAAPNTVGWTDAFLPDKSQVRPKTTNAAAPGF